MDSPNHRAQSIPDEALKGAEVNTGPSLLPKGSGGGNWNCLQICNNIREIILRRAPWLIIQNQTKTGMHLDPSQQLEWQ